MGNSAVAKAPRLSPYLNDESAPKKNGPQIHLKPRFFLLLLSLSGLDHSSWVALRHLIRPCNQLGLDAYPKGIGQQ